MASFVTIRCFDKNSEWWSARESHAVDTKIQKGSTPGVRIREGPTAEPQMLTALKIGPTQ